MDERQTQTRTDKADPTDGAGVVAWLMPAGIALLVSSLTMAAGYFLAQKPQTPVIGKVDLPSVIEEQRKAFLDLVNKGDQEESARYALMSAQALNNAIARLGAECGCVLVVGDAVLYGAADLTPRLRQLIQEHQTTTTASP